MLDVREDFSAGLGPTADPLLPVPAEFARVLRSAQPYIRKRRSQLHRSRMIVGIVDTKGRGIRAQELVNVFREPGFMPKFKCSRNSARKHRQKHLQLLSIALEERR